MEPRHHRFHDDPHHFSNWCRICGLYYCWHPDCPAHEHDGRARHPFSPMRWVHDYEARQKRQISVQCAKCHLVSLYRYNEGTCAGVGIQIEPNWEDPDNGYYIKYRCLKCGHHGTLYMEEHL